MVFSLKLLIDTGQFQFQDFHLNGVFTYQVRDRLVF